MAFYKLLSGEGQIGGKGPVEGSGLDSCPGGKLDPSLPLFCGGTFPDGLPSQLGHN